jgi:hypothetical protein
MSEKKKPETRAGKKDEETGCRCWDLADFSRVGFG